MKINRFIHEVFGDLRVMEDNGELWFLFNDLKRALDIQKFNMSRVDPEDKRFEEVETKGGNQKMLFVSEACMYQVVFVSKKTAAKAFQHWVCHEIIPSIRKIGGYIEGQEALSGEDRAELEMQIKNLHEQVERAVAGKKKLQTLLEQEEARCEQLYSWYRCSMERLDQMESRLADFGHFFCNVDEVESYLNKLKRAKEMDSKCEPFRSKDYEQRRRRERAIASVTIVVNNDPLVVDQYGAVCRRSELLGQDRQR